jgi:hypothetical protein
LRVHLYLNLHQYLLRVLVEHVTPECRTSPKNMLPLLNGF